MSISAILALSKHWAFIWSYRPNIYRGHCLNLTFAKTVHSNPRLIQSSLIVCNSGRTVIDIELMWCSGLVESGISCLSYLNVSNICIFLIRMYNVVRETEHFHQLSGHYPVPLSTLSELVQDLHESNLPPCILRSFSTVHSTLLFWLRSFSTLPC